MGLTAVQRYCAACDYSDVDTLNCTIESPKKLYFFRNVHNIVAREGASLARFLRNFQAVCAIRYGFTSLICSVSNFSLRVQKLRDFTSRLRFRKFSGGP